MLTNCFVYLLNVFVFFAGSGRLNPVQLAFEQELARFVKYMNRKAELGPRWKKPDEEAYARG